MKCVKLIALVSALFPGHIDPGVSICLPDLPAPKPVRETHLLIITKALHDVAAAEQAVLKAVQRWKLFGIKFVVVFDPSGLWKKNDLFWEQFQKDIGAPNLRLVVIGVAWDEACMISFLDSFLGYAWMEIKIFPNGSKLFTGFINLCPQPLQTACGEDEDCWTTVAQHELGHALGLIHHRGSLMRAHGSSCPRSGFTQQDYRYLYNTLLKDRLTHPLLIH